MYTVVAILGIIASLLLIVVVLLQPGKGDLSASFGGLSSQMGSMFGMQKTANLLAKITQGIAAFILVLALATNLFFIKGEQQQQIKSPSVIGRNPEEVQKSLTPQAAPEMPAETETSEPALEEGSAETGEQPAEQPETAPEKTEDQPAE